MVCSSSFSSCPRPDTNLLGLINDLALRVVTLEAQTGLSPDTLNARFDLKADITFVNETFALKTELEDVAGFDPSTLDVRFAEKADTDDVNTALGLKADITYVDNQLDLKASESFVVNAVSGKADAAAVTTALAGKASIAYVDQLFAEINSVSVRALADLTFSNNILLGTNESGVLVQLSTSAFGRTLLNIEDAESARTALGIPEPGSGSGSGSTPTERQFGGGYDNVRNSEVLLRYVSPQPLNFGANLAGWVVKVTGSNPTENMVFAVLDDAITIGSITISPAGLVTLATVDGTSKAIPAGDLISIRAPADAEAVGFGTIVTITCVATIGSGA